MAVRDNPYGAFNYMVRLGDTGGEDQIVGGFSDVSGLGNEVKYSEYRNGLAFATIESSIGRAKCKR